MESTNVIDQATKSANVFKNQYAGNTKQINNSFVIAVIVFSMKFILSAGFQTYNTRLPAIGTE